MQHPRFRAFVLGISFIACGVLVVASPVCASVSFYSSRTTFDAAAAGLPIDHFASSVVFQPYPNNSIFHTRPVDSSTNDGLFPAGCILPGLSITTANPVFASQALKAESAGAGMLSIGAGTFQDVLILDFSPAVSAVGADVFGHVYPGPDFPGNVEVTVYNGAAQIGYSNPSLPGTSGGFVGVTSPAANITRVTFLFNPTADVDANVFVKNVAFGTPAPACCRADFNCSGSVTVGDIFDFLSAWFASDPAADFNGAGGVTVQDIFDFLGAWFMGC